MISLNELHIELKQRLQSLDLEEVILFGSYANNTQNNQSDIDLYVVTKDNFIPKSWDEKSSITKKVSKNLRELRQKVAIDLIVHTKKMNEKFRELNSSFARDIYKNGKVIL